MREPPTIGFQYRPSRALLAATLAVAVLALVAIWLSGLPTWLRAMLTLLDAGVAGQAVGRSLRPRVHALVWRADGSVELSLNDAVGDGRREVLGAITASRVLGPLIALSLRWPPRGHASLWLLPDNLDADTRRRLRMRLGHGIEPSAGPASGNADNA